MKTYTIIIARLVIALSILIINYTYLISQSEFQVNILNNPYPGYLTLDWILQGGFAKLDNYGTFVNNENVSKAGNFFRPLKNGNFAQYAGNQILVYNKDMVKVDSIQNPTSYELDFHDFIQLNNGNYLLLLTYWEDKDLSQIVQGGRSDARLMHNYIIETNRNGQIFWSWDARNYYNILDVTEDIDLTQKLIDFTHINSMSEDENGNILVSVRHLDELSLINKSTGNFIWRMGGSKSKKNQFTFLNDAVDGFVGFSHQHTAEFLPNGNILLYDNGNMRTPQFSRVVEYAYNSSSKTVSKVWEFRNSTDMYSHAMGSAQRLPNGNTLINWSRGLITEVRQDRSIALEISFPTNFPVYRVSKSFSQLKYAARNINSTGSYQFDDSDNMTGVGLNITQIFGSGKTYIQKHSYAPPSSSSFSDSLFSSVLPFRWILSYDSPFTISGSINFDKNDIGNGYDPTKILVYKRGKEVYGIFEQLNTTYNASTGKISANFVGWGEFVMVYVDLSKTTLISPINNTYIPIDGLLKWNKVIGATSYQVHLSTDANFATNKTTSYISTTTQYKFQNLDYNKKYFWKVRCINIKDTSDWSEVYTFNTAIQTPVFYHPPDNSRGVRLTDSVLWNHSEGATSYHIQASYKYDFANPVIDVKNYTKNVYYLSNLLSNNNYYFRIRSFRNTDSSTWSEVLTFRTTLATPLLNLPANEQINIDDKFKFSWSFVSGADNYHLQISETNDFKPPYIDLDNLSSEEIEIENLMTNYKYFWRVKAHNTLDTSEWSETFTFYTVMDAPQLLSPKNGTKNIPVNPELLWDKSGNNDYKVQISEDVEFKNIVLDSMNIKDNHIFILELKPNFTYYWKVKSSLNEKQSKWSEIWNFKTNNSGNFLSAPKLLTPTKGSDNFETVKFMWTKRETTNKFRFQLSENKEFVDLHTDYLNLKTSDIELNNFKTNKTYYWRVKSYSKYDSSAWSEIWDFHIISANQKITLLHPLNDELQIPVNGRIEWQNINDAEYFTVQISYDNEFTKIIEDRSVYNHNYFHYTNLLANTKYFWRVRFVRNGEVSNWSDVWSFRSASDKILATPSILSPSENEIGVPIKGEISWDNISEAISYQVSISDVNNFSTIFLKVQDIISNKTEYSDLEYDVVYYARVSALNDLSTSLWSKPIIFTTELEPPTITYPENNSIDIPISGNFEWTLKNDIYSYQIQIAKDENFENMIVNKNGVENLSLNYNLDEGLTYFIRIKSYNDTNQSRWSKVHKFTTYKKPLSVEDNYFDNLDITYYPNPVIHSLNINVNNCDHYINLTIYDLGGNSIFTEKLICGLNTIDLSKFVAGTYFININGSTRKLIIE